MMMCQSRSGHSRWQTILTFVLLSQHMDKWPLPFTVVKVWPRQASAWAAAPGQWAQSTVNQTCIQLKNQFLSKHCRFQSFQYSHIFKCLFYSPFTRRRNATKHSHHFSLLLSGASKQTCPGNRKQRGFSACDPDHETGPTETRRGKSSTVYSATQMLLLLFTFLFSTVYTSKNKVIFIVSTNKHIPHFIFTASLVLLTSNTYLHG